MNTKTCCACKVDKSASEFHANALRKDGLSTVCKPCAIERITRWKAAHPETVREHSKKRYVNRREHMLRVGRTWEKANPEKVKAKSARGYAKHAERLRAKSRAYQAANREQVLERRKARYYRNHDVMLKKQRENRQRNPATFKKHEMLRMVAKHQATPAWANEFFIGEAYRLARLREKICGGKWHVDHIVPLRSKLVSGLHVEHNLRVIPQKVNQAKGNRHWPDMP